MNSSFSGEIANLLLVDDSLAEVTLFKEILNQDQILFNLFSVFDGYEALDYLHQKEPYNQAKIPDVILLDLNMPEMDGKEVLEKIKKDIALKQIPVIMLSGSETSKEIKEVKDLGAMHYMVKPFSREKLLEALNYLENILFKNEGEQIVLYRLNSNK